MSNLIRVLDIARHFDADRNIFVDLAFKPSTDDKGISVFVCDCGERKSGTVCRHIIEFYSDVTGQPPAFWRFAREDLPNGGTSLVEVKSSSGDDCHRNIIGLSAGRAKKHFKKVQQASLFSSDAFQICIGATARTLAIDDCLAIVG